MVASAFHALSPRELVRAWSRAAARFPVPVGASVGLAVLLLGAIHEGWPEDWEARLISLSLGLGCGLLGALALALRGEIRGWPRALGLGGGVVALAACVALFWDGHDSQQMTLMTFLPGGLFLLTLAAVLAPAPGRSDGAGWREALGDLSACFFGVVVAVILGAGVSFWFLALELLLGVDVPGELYGDVWVVAMVPIWTLSALSRLRGDPEGAADADAEAETEAGTVEGSHGPAMPGWLAILVAGPLTLLALGYLLVVVLYLGRLALEGRFADGEIGLATSLYLAFGVAVHLLSYPLREEGPVLSRFYCRWFPWTLPLPLAALVWALSVRVGDYGWTEPRYLVALMGLWLAIFCLTHLLRPAWARPVLGPLVLGALLVLACAGPWGARSVSISSQMGRFVDLAEDTTLSQWQGGALDMVVLDRERLEEVRDILDWLDERGVQDRASAHLAVPASTLKARVDDAWWADFQSDPPRTIALPGGEGIRLDGISARMFPKDDYGTTEWTPPEGLLSLDTREGEVRLDPPPPPDGEGLEGEDGAEVAPLRRLALGDWLQGLYDGGEGEREAAALSLYGDGLGLVARSLTIEMEDDGPRLTRFEGVVLILDGGEDGGSGF